MPYSSETAKAISERLLEATGQAMLSNDFEDFVQHFCIPNEIQTFEGRRIISTEADLRKTFKAVRTYYDKSGVTDMVRHCVAASFTDENTIVSTHETRLLTGAVISRAPYPLMSVLKFNGERWQVASSSYAIEDEKEHNAALMSAGAKDNDCDPIKTC